MLAKHGENGERRGSLPLLFLYLPNPTNERNVVGYILVVVAELLALTWLITIKHTSVILSLSTASPGYATS